MTRPHGTPTVYKGITFRSKLESIWARYFDELCIPWQYEPKCFQLKTGPYLPDFLLEPCGKDETFVEVKPYIGADTAKAMQLAREIRRDVVVCYGAPNMTTQALYTPDGQVFDAAIVPGKHSPVYKNVGAGEPGKSIGGYVPEIKRLFAAAWVANGLDKF